MGLPWTEKEKETLKNLRKLRTPYELIKNFLPGRTLCAIKAFRYNHPELMK